MRKGERILSSRHLYFWWEPYLRPRQLRAWEVWPPFVHLPHFRSTTTRQKAGSAFKPSGSPGRRLSPVSIAWSKRLRVFLLAPDVMLVHRKVTPRINSAGTHLYMWMEKGTVRIKCQEIYTTFTARARTWTTPEMDALTMRPPRLHIDNYTGFPIWLGSNALLDDPNCYENCEFFAPSLGESLCRSELGKFCHAIMELLKMATSCFAL